MVPSELELSLAVDHEVAGQAEELARQWRARREQAAYEARRAEKRYKAVDPDNRVVARTLEGEWESKLRKLEEMERQYTEAHRTRRVGCRRAIGRECGSWRGIYRQCGDRR